MVSLDEAIAQGLAPDGGLYVPERLPTVGVTGFSSHALPSVASRLLRDFFTGEALAHALDEVCAEAFSFEAPLTRLDDRTSVLELFHGPTSAFKDFGARFLAGCLTHLSTRERLVLVATSGDTGAAVAHAFHRRPGFRVAVLYPDGRVSARQAHQLGAFGDNVSAFRVAGSFDDCQRMVKAAFGNPALTHLNLASANSISLGRLLPQMAYYARAVLERPGLNVIVPTGNLGNAAACLMVRAMGLPVGQVVLATNANRVLGDFLASGSYTPRASVTTLANAMDVGAPSNLERLRAWYSDAELKTVVSARSIDDETIRKTIVATHRRFGRVVCPHTACAVAVLDQFRAEGDGREWLVVSTAHPAKFETIVEPLVGPIEVPLALSLLLSRRSHAEPLANNDAALATRLLS